MGLSKQQMIGAIGGGVFGLGVLGLGFLFYSAWSDKSEIEQDLEDQAQAFNRLVSSAVYPSPASIKSVKSNATSYVKWYDEAVTLAARGDKTFAGETASQFKGRLQREVRGLLDLSGQADGKIAAPDFLFGFDRLLGPGGVMPESDKVPDLAIQLDAITSIVNLFHDAAVARVDSVERLGADTAAKPAAPAGGGAKSGKKPVPKAKEDPNAPKQTKHAYQFTIAASPRAIVEVLNGLASSKRFMVVRNLSIEASNTIDERLAAAEKAKKDENAPKTSSRRRMRGAAAAAVAAGEDPAQVAAANRVITDPAVEEPLKVSFTVDVYDFGRPASAVAEKPAEEKKEEKK